MTSKGFANFDATRAEALADQVGILTWVIAMLVIGLNLVMRLSGLNACAPIVALSSACVYPLGLLLIVIGLLHLFNTAIRRRIGPPHPRTRYARGTWIPLWYRTYANPAGKSALRFDHGQAWAWGVQCLLGAAIIQTAANLAMQQPVWANLTLLAALIPLHVLLAESRARIAAHGHA
jgi:hypothetical protein